MIATAPLPAGPNACRGILSVWNDMAPTELDFYEEWYMTEHFPERLGVPGFRRGRRYEAVEADRRYFTFYELDTPEVLFSDVYLGRLGSPTAWTQRIMTHWSGMLRTVCERVERRGKAVGGYAAVARWEDDVRLPVGFAARLESELTDRSIVALDIWCASERQNTPTAESLRRKVPDRNITAAVVVETTRLANAARAAATLPALLVGGIAPPASIGLYRLIALQDADG